MKILELRFKNLNSLYGEWIIDFTDPEYVSNGIFALTGTTGAGKSTILDAICLALYGATPRLGKITRSGNEIMSRQTGECYAEVLFESLAGRFRCHWEQRRARKKPDGNLQDQEHQISDADTGKPIETKKSLVAGIIEEKTGMDFDRFTRSILLAQGGFDTFLKADVEQKSKILEQITGTGIYSEISRRVHERRRDESEKLGLLQAETSGIAILTPEQEKEIQQELTVKQKEDADLSGKLTETGKAIEWLFTVDGLKKEITTLVEEAAKQQRDIEAFKPEQNKLERAMKAASLDGDYATLTALRKEQSDDQAALKTHEAAIPGLEASAKNQAELYRLAEEESLKTKEKLKAAAPLIQRVRSLDQRLAEQKKAIAEGEERCERDGARIGGDKKAQLIEQKKRTQAEKNLKLADVYLKKHAEDEWLISGLGGVEEQVTALLAGQREIAQKEVDLKDAAKALERAAKKLEAGREQCSVCRQKLEDRSKALHQGKDALNDLLGGRLLREYRKEKDTLLREMVYLRKIEELEDHRARLEDGKPCPLCGSEEHPFATGNVPAADKTEQKIESFTKVITKAEDLESSNKKLEGAEAAARNNLTESEKLEAVAANDKKAARKALGELKETLEKLRAEFLELKQTLSAKLKSLGITEIPETQISSLVDSLRSRLKSWQEEVGKKLEIEKQIVVIDSELKRLDAVIETQTIALDERQERLETLKKVYAAESTERKNLYGEKKPDKEESRLNSAVAGAEEGEKKARALNEDLQQKLNTAKTQVQVLKKRIEQREPELKKTEAGFLSALQTVGFTCEKQFFEARMTAEERNALSARAKELDKAQTEIKARQKDRETRLSLETEKKITDKALDELEPQFKEHEESLKELRNAVAALQHRLSENAASKERVKEKQAAIEAQKKECLRWEKLHGLIGSADGKKYRNFAQGLTFELMVSHANRQLGKMTDRYLLIRDDRQPLELNVVDNYQAGEIRSTKNLSGGESFIVSLTLALGLSKMASRKVRVDSLFLDEGFGTLDEESLETALETLSGLQQDGKLIGIISHVSAMKERIGTLITITPLSGGRSTLAGPGCSKIS